MRRVLAPIVALSFATALLFVQAGQVTGAAVAESQLARALPYAASSTPPGTDAATVIVPDLRGLSEMDAVNALLATGLQPGSRFEIQSDQVPAGMVIETDPTAGTEVDSGSVVDYVVATAPSVSSTAEPTSEPTPAPSPEPTATTGSVPSVRIIGSSSTVHWDAYFERIRAFLGTFYPATMAWSAALEDRDFEQATTLAATMRQASLDLFAWLDDNPPDQCYLASWQAFHHGTELLAAAMDVFTTEGLDAAAEQFIPAGSALAEAGATIQDAGDACRTWVGDTDCSTWLEESIPITGDMSRFTLQASPNWRRLEPGDVGWVTLFGAHGSAVEQQVTDGAIGDFIVPVEPPDADRSVNLAVYVLQASADDTPATLADHHAAYLRTLGRFLEVADRGELALPAGNAARVTAVRTELPGEAPKRDVLDTYLLIHDGRTYYLEFISSEATADRYGEEFGCMIASLRWLPAASPSEPDRQSPLPGRSPTAITTILEARAGHTATLLPDGRVLIVGGLHDLEQDPDSALATAELWDPATGMSSPAGTLADGRSYHTATLLQDGRVLIAGGGPATLELWDPASLTFSPAGTLSAGAVFGNTSTLLPDGRVLIVGGYHKGDATIWDPAANTFSRAGRMLQDRTGHTATLLADGRVLVVGGDTGLRSAEVWDPTTQSFKRSRSLATGRYGHTSTLLRDGCVLVVGGTNQTSGSQRVTEETLSSAELRDAGTGLFTSVGSLADARTGHVATFMPDGRVLLLAGDGINGALATAELWDPEDLTFAPTTPLAEARTDFTATLLQDGRVLVVGGFGEAGDDQVVLASVELWDAPPASP